MVLSGSKRVSSTSSIKNQAQGGGPNKPGLPPSVAKTSWEAVHYDERSIPKKLGNYRITPSYYRLNQTYALNMFTPRTR